MSTRANIVIKDQYDELWFYRHSDGYPEGTMPTLEKFLGWVKEGKIRNNPQQAAGWLIMIGALENNKRYVWKDGNLTRIELSADQLLEPLNDNWKVGAYEPSTGQHGDIEYLYTIDLDKKTITVEEV